MSIWWTLASSIVILVGLVVLLFWEGRRSSTLLPYPQPPIWSVLPAMALFGYLMRPLWLTMPGTALLLFAGLAAFGWFLLKFGSRRPAKRD
jgi:hypothetical protein